MIKFCSTYFLLTVLLIFSNCSSTKPDLQTSTENQTIEENAEEQTTEQKTTSPEETADIKESTEQNSTTNTTEAARADSIEELKTVLANNTLNIERLAGELNYLKENYLKLSAKSAVWTDPFEIYNKKIILNNGTTIYGNIIFQDDTIIQVETLIGTLAMAKTDIVRVVDHQIHVIKEPEEFVDIIKNEEASNTNKDSLIFINSAKVILMGEFLENQDENKNTILSGRVQNVGQKRADFVKINFAIYKDKKYNQKPQEYTVFVKGSTHEFENEVISKSTLMPKETGTFQLMIPSNFGPFLSYSYSLDWEQYE